MDITDNTKYYLLLLAGFVITASVIFGVAIYIEVVYG